MKNLLQRAEEIARQAHKDQFRRDGKTPYITHVEDVVSRLEGENEKIVAWLHDVVEDTDVTVEDLRKEFPIYISYAVDQLTHEPNAPYHGAYIHSIGQNPLARHVKIADILSNMSDQPTPRQVKKYTKALGILLSYAISCLTTTS
jgi:(p)ppGpp synthase/HD superfamily hydrolase